MKVEIETERLILRDILGEDARGMLAMDSDPEVHRFLGNQPVQTLAEIRDVIAFIRQQYEELGVGRLAVIEKQSGQFVGWSGLKLVKTAVLGMDQYYDLGYRFARKYWGKGYATESALASLNLAFATMNLPEVWATADVENFASQKVMEKAGMSRQAEQEYYDRPHYFYRIQRQEWDQGSKI